MIGSRATSGSVATTFRNVRIASSPSRRSASMLTSRMFAPPRTCSSATSTAPAKSPASTSRRKRAEPVTFVRSPISTKPVSGPISNGSRPLQRGPRAAAYGTRRGASPAHRRGDRGGVLGRRAAAAPGDVEEARPRRTRGGARSSPPASRRSRRTRSGGPAFGCALTRHGASRASSATYGRSSCAPSEQLTPAISGSACSTEAQNASIVCPERLRPERSTIVAEIHSGTPGAASRAAVIAAFAVQRVEDRLDEQQVDAALDERRASARRTRPSPGRTCASGTTGRRPSG